MRILFSIGVCFSVLCSPVFATDFVHNTDGSVTAPDGLIWGALVKNAGGQIENMTRPEAQAYCARIGNRLPTEAEFQTLRTQLGHPTNYIPTPVPGLRNYWSWSASDYSGAGIPVEALAFDGSDGDMVIVGLYDRYAVRCVRR